MWVVLSSKPNPTGDLHIYPSMPGTASALQLAYKNRAENKVRGVGEMQWI
jgi:hypothetical protein